MNFIKEEGEVTMNWNLRLAIATVVILALWGAMWWLSATFKSDVPGVIMILGFVAWLLWINRYLDPAR